MKINIGIMQGRLCPRGTKYQAFPGKENALKEFHLAKTMGFSHIELIADEQPENYLALHPFPYYIGLFKDLESLLKVSKETGVAIRSVCADIFMTYPLWTENKDARIFIQKILTNIVNYSGYLGIKSIVIPFVDESSAKTKDDLARAKESLEEVLPSAKQLGIDLCLEMDLKPKDFYKYVKSFRNSNLKINYDVGNSASLGYNIDEEFDLYGRRIKVIHIKDRLFRGHSIELGKGNVDWEKFFKHTKRFKGVMTMQAARAVNQETELGKVQSQLTTFIQLMEVHS